MTNMEYLKEKYPTFSLDNLGNFEVQLRSQNRWVNCREIDLDEDDINNLYHRSEFRPKPFKPFEIGDWVKPSYTKPSQLNENNIGYYNGTRWMAQETNADIWFPVENELVIDLPNSSDDTIIIRRVKEFNQNTMKVYFNTGYLNYNEIEPINNNRLK